MKVLVVDDGDVVRMVMKRVLNKLGHEVETAQDGAEALKRLEQEKFDLMITDIRMPELNGMELIRRIKDNLDNTMRLIVCSSVLDEQDLRYLASNNIPILSKPFSLSDVSVMISNDCTSAKYGTKTLAVR